MGARITGMAVHLPETTLTSGEVTDRITGYRPPAGLVERLTGVRSLHVMPADWQASDLAAEAARKLFADTGTDPADVDLLLFASASQDMVEPATAHIVAAKLGLSCPVFDVKNACNSVLNAVEVADALIGAGGYRRVLIASGEAPSRAVRWDVPDLKEYLTALPGYTLSDAGAALVMERSDRPGVLGSGFSAHSEAWQVGTLPAGGSAHPRDPAYSYFRLDGAALKDAFDAFGAEIVLDTLGRLGLGWDDFAVVAVHQVSLPYLEILRERLGIPADKLVVTLAEHGNLASASLPFQLVRAREAGRLGPGDRVCLIGLAGGVSMGVMAVEL
ncbi:3-oxoacyl-ACP synthase III family protein [Longispora urticae]